MLTKLFRRRPEPETPLEPPINRAAIHFLTPKSVVFAGYHSDDEIRIVRQSYALYEVNLAQTERRRMIALAAPLGEI